MITWPINYTCQQRKKCCSNGFVLIEALIAIALLVISIVCLLQYQAHVISLLFMQSKQVEVLTNIRNLLEDLKSNGKNIVLPEQWSIGPCSVRMHIKDCPFELLNEPFAEWFVVSFPWPAIGRKVAETKKMIVSSHAYNYKR